VKIILRRALLALAVLSAGSLGPLPDKASAQGASGVAILQIDTVPT
jgi:hypothetical protein